MEFDLSDPKIVFALMLGALVGGIVPYTITATITSITKWLLFVAIAGRGPRVSSLLVVAFAELGCLFLAAVGATWLGIVGFPVACGYVVLATFPNLLLFLPSEQYAGRSQMRKGLAAFGLGWLFPLWAILVYMSFAVWLRMA